MSARTILKHVYENGGMTQYQYERIDRVLKERERPQWIPVTERLPEVVGRYIVTEKRFAVDDRNHKGRYQTIVEEVTFSNNKWSRANFFEIVAWMPLPEPYEGSH